MTTLEAPSQRAHAEERTRLSDLEVAAGRAPLRRTSASVVVPLAAHGDPTNTQVNAASSWDVLLPGLEAVLMRVGRTGLEAALLGGHCGDTITPIQASDANMVAQNVAAIWMTQRSTLVVFEDGLAQARFMQAADRQKVRGFSQGHDPLMVTAHQMQLSLALPASTRVVVLSDAVEQTFWRPSSVAQGDFGQWAKLFTNRAGFERMRDVLVRILSGRASDLQTRYAKSAARAEAALLSGTTGWRDPASAIGAFQASTSVVEAYSAYLAADAARLPESCAAGTAPLVEPVGANKGYVLARISSPCRLKVRSSVRVIDPSGEEIGKAWLAGLTFDDDRGLVGLFSSDQRAFVKGGVPASTSRGFRWLSDQVQLRSGARAHLVAEPFLATDRSTGVPRWALGDTADVGASRDVPLDVSLAGAGS